ncbi:MAG: hypothetical protein WC718_03040 [Phycisphaerales bacterium]|jgi:hypothetical protein
MRNLMFVAAILVPQYCFGQILTVVRAHNVAYSQLTSDITVHFADPGREVLSGKNNLTYAGHGQALHGGRGNSTCDFANGPDGISLAQSISRFGTWTGPAYGSDNSYQLPTGYVESIASGASCVEDVAVGAVAWSPSSVVISNFTTLSLEEASGSNPQECGADFCDVYSVGFASGDENSNEVVTMVVGSATSDDRIYFDLDCRGTTWAGADQTNYLCADPLVPITCIGTPAPLSISNSLTIKLSVYEQKVVGGVVSKGKLIASTTLAGGYLADSASLTISPTGIFNNTDADLQDMYDNYPTCLTSNGYEVLGFSRLVSWFFIDQDQVVLHTLHACVVEVQVIHDVN